VKINIEDCVIAWLEQQRDHV
jgi:hypothetical protein